MEYNVKKLPNSEVEISIELSKEEFEKHRQKAAEDISKEVKIQGFRPGHAPLHVLEQHVGKTHIDNHAQELAIQQSYVDVVMKEKLQVVARPKISIQKSDPLSYTATVAIMPEVEIKDYKSIKVPKTEVKVTDKDVQEVLDDMKKYGTLYKDTDEKAKMGDRVEVDFEGFDGDKALEGTKSANHPVILGSNSLIPGFEEELVGLKKDDKKEFDITFPKDYHKKDFQNKKIKFKVEVKRVEKGEDPEFDEAFIEKLTGKKMSLDQLKQDIEKNIQARKTEEAKRERENKYIEELLKKVDVKLPESLIDEEVEHIIHEMKHDIAGKGMEFDKFLEQSKITEDDLRKKYRPEGEKRLKVRLALQKLIHDEKIEVSDDEAKAEFEKVKSFYPDEQHAKIQQDFESGELKNQIYNRLALRKLFAKLLP